MKNSEEAIEKVLAGLRDTEALAGMEGRILNELEERAAARSRSGWRGLLPVWLFAPARPVAVGSVACGVALAGIFVVALAIPAIRRLGPAPVQARRSSAPVGSPVLGAPEAAAKSSQPASLRFGVRSAGKIKSEEGRNAESAAAGVDSDAVALEEMHAASRPAPPMPLTEQERLLLRLVHKDDPVELAMLDSKMRALQDSEDKAEFQRFFGQSTKQPAPEQSSKLRHDNRRRSKLRRANRRRNRQRQRSQERKSQIRNSQCRSNQRSNNQRRRRSLQINQPRSKQHQGQ